MRSSVVFVLSLFASLCIFISTASATIYEYEVNNPSGNDAAGNVSHILSRYNTFTEEFSWEHTIEDVSSELSDGFWLVISNGPNPKGIAGELVIFYGDLDTSTVTAYEYNGTNSNTSYSNPGNYLDSFTLTSSDSGTDSRTMSFGGDFSTINALALSADWQGVQFGTKFGYWFHPLLGADYDYDGDEIDDFDFEVQGWYDKNNKDTREVPEPMTALLLAAGVPLLRKKKQVTA